MASAVTQSDYNKVIDYIPVRKKNQIIIPYEMTKKQFAFNQNDINQLIRYSNNDQAIHETIRKIQTDSSLNPQLNTGPKVVSFILYLFYAILFLVLMYLFIGVFIFFLGDPVICFIYAYLIMYQVWWRGGRVGIELIVESRRSKPLESYLNKQNQRVYQDSKLKWSVGGKGKWIQIDNNRLR